MNPISIIIYSYFFIACLLVYFLLRDLKIPGLFFNKHKKSAYFTIIILAISIVCAIYAHFVEPFILITKQATIQNTPFQNPIKLAFVADIQVGNHKKTQWVQKIVEKIDATNPDLVVIGGDLISNEGTFENESLYLEPLRKIAEKYPSFYVLGNHEYGLGQMDASKRYLGSGDRTQEVMDEMKNIGITLLKNDLKCLEIKNQNICLFGIDDIYAGINDFSQLKNLPENIPLLFITHNPDGILGYPEIYPKPFLTIAGHTHGGQVYLPVLGPIGSVNLILPKKFYRGLNYWQNMPIYTTIGAGESGGQIRFLAIPEIVLFNLTP